MYLSRFNSDFENSKAYHYLHDLSNLPGGHLDVLDSIRNHQERPDHPQIQPGELGQINSDFENSKA